MVVYFIPTWLDHSAKGLSKISPGYFYEGNFGGEFIFKSLEST